MWSFSEREDVIDELHLIKIIYKRFYLYQKYQK